MQHPTTLLSAGSVPVHPKYFVLSPCETAIEATLHGVPDVVAAVDRDDHDQALAFVDPRADPVAAGPDPHAGAILALLGGGLAHAGRSGTGRGLCWQRQEHAARIG